VRFVELLAEKPPHRFRVPHLCRQPGETCRDLGIEHRPRESGDRQKHLEILARSVHHLEHPVRREYLCQRRELRERQWIDAHRLVGAGHLHEAQLGAISALAQKLGVEANARKRGKTCGAGGECGCRGDEGLQTDLRMICTIESRDYARPAPFPKDMSEFIRLYTQIALLRRGPQDLPASRLLLVLTVAGYFAVNFIVSSLLPPEDRWRENLLVGTLFTLLWYVLLLRLAGRPERTLQTTTAVFGFQGVLAPLVVICGWLVRRFGEGSPWQLPVVCAGLLVLAWLLAANSYIVRAALEWSATSSVALVILETLAGWLLQSALFPPVKT
jgi:hypothetical protein